MLRVVFRVMLRVVFRVMLRVVFRLMFRLKTPVQSGFFRVMFRVLFKVLFNFVFRFVLRVVFRAGTDQISGPDLVLPDIRPSFADPIRYPAKNLENRRIGKNCLPGSSEFRERTSLIYYVKVLLFHVSG